MTRHTPVQVFLALRQNGASPAQAILWTAIAGAESGYDDHATNTNKNGSTDYGMFQINSVHLASDGLLAGWSPDRLYDLVQNTEAARIVSRGWKDPTQWTTYTSGSYKKFQPEAMRAAAVGAIGPSAVGVGDPNDPVSQAIGGAVDVISAPLQAIQEVSKIWETLTTPQTWVRIGYFIGGGALVLIGVNILISKPLAATATKAVTGYVGLKGKAKPTKSKPTKSKPTESKPTESNSSKSKSPSSKGSSL